jgi:guanylate kinase
MSLPSDQRNGLLLIISGPSGVGKTTITRHVENELDGVFSVSMTTRPPGPDDIEGVDYFFVSRPQFEAHRDAGELLEWAEVFGNCYGTPRGPVQENLAAGRLVILEIDVQGASQVKGNMPESYAVFVLPPSEEALLQRLRSRQREDEATIQKRFAKAKDEIARARTCGIYDQFVVNDDLESAVARTVTLVRKELQRRSRV